MQAQEQRMRGMLVEAAARGDAVFHGEWLAKSPGTVVDSRPIRGWLAFASLLIPFQYRGLARCAENDGP